MFDLSFNDFIRAVGSLVHASVGQMPRNALAPSVECKSQNANFRVPSDVNMTISGVEDFEIPVLMRCVLRKCMETRHVTQQGWITD